MRLIFKVLLSNLEDLGSSNGNVNIEIEWPISFFQNLFKKGSIIEVLNSSISVTQYHHNFTGFKSSNNFLASCRYFDKI